MPPLKTSLNKFVILGINTLVILIIGIGIFYQLKDSHAEETTSSNKESQAAKNSSPIPVTASPTTEKKLPLSTISETINTAISNNPPIEKPSQTVGLSPLSGKSCLNWDHRPLAIIYSGNIDARNKLKNLSAAAVVVEMQHRALYEQPRLMGVFQCTIPSEAGPMRSGRTDFLSFAGSLDAVFVPWGGSSIVKTLLRENILDHVDCNGELSFSGANTKACYLDDSIELDSAKSAFSNGNELIKIFNKYRFRRLTKTKGFSFTPDISRDKRPSFGQVNIKYDEPYRIKYLYDDKTNSYKRYHGEIPHIDAATGEQYSPKNIVTIITKMEAWNKNINYESNGLRNPWENIDTQQKEAEHGQYPNFQLGDPWFDTVHNGPATFFINGQKINGSWKHKGEKNAPFIFYDKNNQLIKFVPGQTWIHILKKGSNVSYYSQPKNN